MDVHFLTGDEGTSVIGEEHIIWAALSDTLALLDGNLAEDGVEELQAVFVIVAHEFLVVLT